MDNQFDILKSDSRPTGSGPGERLQAARIQQGLAVEDIAGRMHLNVQIVKSIESNNFDDITAPIFVKGYLRAYARIVSLDEEEMIQQYANYYSHEDPPITTTSHLAPELSVADVRIKWTTYLVILVLAALLAAWWWNKSQDEAQPISLDTQTSSDAIARQVTEDSEYTTERQAAAEPPVTATSPSPSAEPPLSATPQPVTPPAESRAVAEPAAIQQEPAQPAEPQPPAAPAMVAEESVAERPAEIPAVAVEETSRSDLPVAPEAAAEIEPAIAQPRLGAPLLVAPSGEDKLSLAFSADTWADIRDGSGLQMVYHLLRAGQSLELTGSAPFSVFLGNAPGAEIRFNGEPIEFSARIRSDNTARLKIGG